MSLWTRSRLHERAGRFGARLGVRGFLAWWGRSLAAWLPPRAHVFQFQANRLEPPTPNRAPLQSALRWWHVNRPSFRARPKSERRRIYRIYMWVLMSFVGSSCYFLYVPDNVPILLLDHQPRDAAKGANAGVALQLSGL